VENNIRILLIEDNPGDAFLIEEYLDEFANFPYELIIAETLNEALFVLKEQPLDIVMPDLSLPDSDGINTLFSIHNENPLVPIIILSGLNEEIIASYAIENGAHDFFDKGKTESRLLDSIKQCVLS
jgi:two-component system, cell cycle sensor histidine kinase and response regulator CckA